MKTQVWSLGGLSGKFRCFGLLLGVLFFTEALVYSQIIEFRGHYQKEMLGNPNISEANLDFQGAADLRNHVWYINDLTHPPRSTFTRDDYFVNRIAIKMSPSNAVLYVSSPLEVYQIEFSPLIYH